MLTTKVTEKSPGFFEVALGGRLDTETYGEFEKVAAGLLVKGGRGVRLDLAGLNYISSMGLRVVLKLAKDLRAKARAFQMVNLKPQIQKVFDIAATLPAETVFASVAEADAYFDAMQKRVLEGGGNEASD